MNKTDKLFVLINSLNKGEKRHFYLFADRYNNSTKTNYRKLFDFIEKQKNYNEQAIRKHFIGERFLNQLTFTKNYLYNLIMDSLKLYHENDSIENSIRSDLSKIELLFNKELFVQANIIVKKIKKLAIQHEKFVLLLTIIYWEELCMARINEAEMMLRVSEDNIKERIKIFNFIKQHALLNQVVQKILFQLSKIGTIRSMDDLKPIQQIMNKEVFQSNDFKNLSKRGESYIYYIYSTYYWVSKEYSKTLEYTKLLISQLEQDSEQITENPYNYISALNNIMLIALATKDYALFNQYKAIFDKAKYLKKLTNFRTLALSIRVNIINLEISKLHQEAKFLDAKKLINTTEWEPYFNNNKLSRLALNAKYNIAYNAFILEDFDTAIHWINEINASPIKNTREDLYSYTRLLEIICHYEIGNMFLLESKAISYYRYLRNKDRLFEFEKLSIALIKKLFQIGITNQTTITAIFKNFHSKFKKIFNNPFEKEVLQHFDLLCWLESKINNETFSKAAMLRIKNN